jgi:hypothetical protein
LTTLRPPGVERPDRRRGLDLDAVKTHLRALYKRLGLDDLPQAEKRVCLAEIVLVSGFISRREPDTA